MAQRYERHENQTKGCVAELKVSDWHPTNTLILGLGYRVRTIDCRPFGMADPNRVRRPERTRICRQSCGELAASRNIAASAFIRLQNETSCEKVRYREGGASSVA